MPKNAITPFSNGGRHSNETHPGGKRAHYHQDECGSAYHSPAQRAENRAFGNGSTETYEQNHHEEALDLLCEVVKVLMILVSALNRSKRRGGDEDGQEAIAMQQLGRTVCETRDTESDQPVFRF